MKNSIKFLPIITLIFFATSCIFLNPVSNAQTASKRILKFPEPNSHKDFFRLLWVNGELIVFTGNSGSLEYARINDEKFTEDILPEDDYCTMSTQYHVLRAFPNGNLTLLKYCYTDNEDGTPTSLITFNWETGNLRILAERMPLGTADVYWNPNGERGLVMLRGGYFNTTLFNIDSQGNFGQLDRVISDEGKSWNLSNFYPDTSDEVAGYTGNAERADWSPNGKQVAFFGSSDAIGNLDFDRIYAEYKIFFMDENYTNIHPVVDEVFSPSTLKWSPDSKYIVFLANYGRNKKEGMWIYSVEQKKVYPVDEGNFRDITWDPAGDKVYAIKCKDLVCKEVIEYSLRDYLADIEKQ